MQKTKAKVYSAKSRHERHERHFILLIRMLHGDKVRDVMRDVIQYNVTFYHGGVARFTNWEGIKPPESREQAALMI
jgi:hypothetical protein